jgi:hypothetical protein
MGEDRNDANGLVPLALIATGVVTAAVGAVAGLKGGWEIRKANGLIRDAGMRYDDERGRLEAQARSTNDSLQALGKHQADALRQVVERMADFLRRHQKQVSESEKLLADGLDSTPRKVALEAALGQDALAWMRGIVGSAVTGAGLNAGIPAAVSALATASTGTAISSLSGAAATNATLAFLGGGSLASGGGGMALGAAALNFVTIGPAIFVSGLMVAGQGEKAKTKARAHEATVNIAIAEMQTTKATFEAIVARAEELGTLLDQLVARGTSALDHLESEPFDPDHHDVRFWKAMTLAVAVRDVASAQIVSEAGDLNEETAVFKLRYRPLIKETDGD